MTATLIVSTARTAISRAFRGALNHTKSPTLAAHVIRHAVDRAGIEAAEVDDVLLGTALAAGTAGMNVARLAALTAGLPSTVPAMTLDRQCASGLMAIAAAANQIAVGAMHIIVAGGQENVSALNTPYLEWAGKEKDANVEAAAPHAYMSMIQTAEFVADKYAISREEQDLYALESQRRTASAQAAGRFDNEIVPMATRMLISDKVTGETSTREVVLSRDEGNRPDTTLEGLAGLKAVIDGGTVTAGNASQLSDGASACVLMHEGDAGKRGAKPLGRYLGVAVAGCGPEEMGVGPIYAVPKLLKQHGLRIEDIGLWELNEAFAVQVLYCRNRLGIDPASYNVDGGGISIGHPYGMTGSRLVGHALLEGKRRGAKYVVAGMCVGGGMGVAALFETL